MPSNRLSQCCLLWYLSQKYKIKKVNIISIVKLAYLCVCVYVSVQLFKSYIYIPGGRQNECWTRNYSALQRPNQIIAVFFNTSTVKVGCLFELSPQLCLYMLGQVAYHVIPTTILHNYTNTRTPVQQILYTCKNYPLLYTYIYIIYTTTYTYKRAQNIHDIQTNRFFFCFKS